MKKIGKAALALIVGLSILIMPARSYAFPVWGKECFKKFCFIGHHSHGFNVVKGGGIAWLPVGVVGTFFLLNLDNMVAWDAAKDAGTEKQFQARGDAIQRFFSTLPGGANYTGIALP